MQKYMCKCDVKEGGEAYRGYEDYSAARQQETCVQCGSVFIIMLDEFISKLDSGMKLPRRCPRCRRENRRNPDPYRGWQQQECNTRQQRDTVIRYMAVFFMTKKEESKCRMMTEAEMRK